MTDDTSVYSFQLAQKPIPLNRVQVLLHIYAIFSFWYNICIQAHRFEF